MNKKQENFIRTQSKRVGVDPEKWIDEWNFVKASFDKLKKMGLESFKWIKKTNKNGFYTITFFTDKGEILFINN